MISVFVSDKVKTVRISPWSGSRTTVHDEFQLSEYKNWCKEFVGGNNWNYYGPHKKIPCEFRFKKPEDALAFKLRFDV
jgi:hypothetical protein